MGIYAQMVLTLGPIIAIYLIYKNSDKNEEFLVMKLIGYCLIGSFRFNLNTLAIPLGFIVYLIVLHPQRNIRAKKHAALVGLIVFAFGLAIPKYNDYVFTRPIDLVAQSTNLFDKTLTLDWANIKERLNLHDASIHDVRIDFEKDGNLKSLHFLLVTNKDGGIVHYNVDLFDHKRKYTIYPSKIDKAPPTSNSLSANEFFNMLDRVNISEILPQVDYPWYSIHVQGNVNNYVPTANDNFMLLTSQGVKIVGEKDSPFMGVSLTLFGMTRTSDTSYSSAESRFYVLSW